MRCHKVPFTCPECGRTAHIIEIDVQADGVLFICGICNDCGLEFFTERSISQLRRYCEVLDRARIYNIYEAFESLETIGKPN